jgi:Ca-activated chloride channel family protein
MEIVMLSWQWSFLFWLVPLPLLVRWLLPARDATSGAIQVPFYSLLRDLDASSESRIRGVWLTALLVWLVWFSLLAAAARPTWIGDAVSVPQDRRDLMLAVDISLSMREADMLVQKQYTDRLSAVKAVVGQFIKQRTGDRIGLILFGQEAYLQTPLTFDSNTVRQQLEEAQLGFAGNATAIGDTIGLATKKLRDRPADSRVLILLTDGANTAGAAPAKAASIAAEAGIRIHTIGVGADMRQVKDIFGRTRTRKTNTDLDEKTLLAIAQQTGGQYFRSHNPRELQNIYAELDRLEPIPVDQTFRQTRSLSHWPIGLALSLSGLLMLLAARRGGLS